MLTERKCVMCGTGYYYCPSCGHGDIKDAYKFAFCSLKCKTIDQTIIEYKSKKISAMEAKKILKELDVKDENNYPKLIAKEIAEVLNSGIEVEPVSTMEISLEEIVESKGKKEDSIIEEVHNTVIEEETKIEIQPEVVEQEVVKSSSRRRRKKSNADNSLNNK